MTVKDCNNRYNCKIVSQRARHVKPGELKTDERCCEGNHRQRNLNYKFCHFVCNNLIQ